MKIDKLARHVFRKLDSFNREEINDSHENYDDDYYIRINGVPPRFELYRKAKLDDVDYTVTIDELNFGLKRELAITPEQRYLRKKAQFPLSSERLSFWICGFGVQTGMPLIMKPEGSKTLK